MRILVKASVPLVLLLTVNANSSAQPRAAIDSYAKIAVPKSPPQPPACFDGTPHKRLCSPYHCSSCRSCGESWAR